MNKEAITFSVVIALAVFGVQYLVAPETVRAYFLIGNFMVGMAGFWIYDAITNVRNP